MSELIIDAGALRRTYRVTEGGVQAAAVSTHGRTVPIEDLGFRLVVDGRAVRAGEMVPAAGGPAVRGGHRASWRLDGDGLAVDVVVEAEPEAPVVRTRLAVSGRGRLQFVDVERWSAPVLRGPTTADAGDPRALGQPLWGDGLFAGVEHPGAENLLSPEGGASFGLPVDVNLSPDPFVTPPFAVGGSPPGRERAAFWDELDRLRAAPARLVVLANNWYQLGAVGRMDEATVTAELAGFGAVCDRHELGLDWYCLDDPWDGDWEAPYGLWGRLSPSRFPNGMPALQAAATAGVGGIGLWLSPWGGYFDRHDARVAWGRQAGFEVQEGRWPCLCPAGNRYRGHLINALTRWTAAGVRYWKLDGVQFNCQSTGHGHAAGPGGRTAQIDRFAALLDEVRAVDPGVVLAFTTGSNPSPWWLRHADFLWRGGLDDDAPAEHPGGRHERFATYIDSCLDALRATALPVSAIVTFSLVENEARTYRDAAAGPHDWERHCWLLAGRGTHHHDLYVAPDSLSEDEWATLGRALTWARTNQRVLARSRMVGGRPQAGEPYGFVSTSAADGQVILCLRNPADADSTLILSPDDLGGEVDDLLPVWGRRVPAPTRGHGLTVDLGPFEVSVLSGRWRPAPAASVLHR